MECRPLQFAHLGTIAIAEGCDEIRPVQRSPKDFAPYILSPLQGWRTCNKMWYSVKRKKRSSEGHRERHPLGDCISIINVDGILH